MKICPSCDRCYEDAETTCALEPLVSLVHERDGTLLIDGRYHLDYRIGRGAMGAVYKCTHIELNQPRAIKLLRPDSSYTDLNRQLRLRREALTACRFDHPNIVRIYDSGTNIVSFEEDGKTHSYEELYIVMEFLEGKTLKDFLKKNKPVPLEKAISIAIQISDGLAEVHTLHVIFRDLKPENIMLTNDRCGNLLVKLVDFGAVKLLSHVNEPGDADLTRDMFIGSPLYASPENCKNDPLDERSDIYSLGVILYEMLSGGPPFPPSSWLDLLTKHAYSLPPPLVNVDADLSRLVDRALSKDPKERPQSAAAFAGVLRTFERSIERPSSPKTKSVFPATPIMSSAVTSPIHNEDTGEDEETLVAIRVHTRNYRKPSLTPPRVKARGGQKESPLGLSQKVKTAGTGGGAADPKRTSCSPLAGDIENITQENVKNNERQAVSDKRIKTKPTLSNGFRTLTATILILSSLSASIFQIWRLAHKTPPDGEAVKVAEGSDTPAPYSFSSDVGDELITKTDVNIRLRHSGKSMKVGLAEKGSRVRILARYKNWRKIIVLEHGRDKEDPDSADQGWIDGDNLVTANDES